MWRGLVEQVELVDLGRGERAVEDGNLVDLASVAAGAGERCEFHEVVSLVVSYEDELRRRKALRESRESYLGRTGSASTG